MHIGKELVEFLALVIQLHSQSDLMDLMADTTRRLGFRRFALVSHVDLVQEAEEAVALSNYDDGWIDQIYSERYYLDDPIHAASTLTVTSFPWHDVTTMIQASKRQLKILEEAARFGLRDGVTVPVHAPGEYRGTCSFAVDHPVELDVQLRGACQLVAMYAFEAGRCLVRSRLGIDNTMRAIPHLSPRQIDCVGLIASGKGDAQIAALLGVSEPTVHQHIGEAMRRYGVFKRTALVFRALFDGQICFHKSV
jgi:LuxR family quorum-sensing system transcriptional regulator CciR